MALTLTNTTLSDPADKTEVETNFSDVVNKFAGNITMADLSSSAGLTLAQMANTYERMLVQFVVRHHLYDVAADYINGQAAASLSAVAATAHLDICPIPGDSSDTNWQISDVSWHCTDTGDGNTTVRIEWGYRDGAGAWTISSTPVSDFAIAANGGANLPGDAHQVNGANTTINFNDVTGGNTPRSLALVMGATPGVGTMSAVGSSLHVAVLLRRQIQAS